MSETPEFDNWKEIEHLLDTNGGSNNREIAIVKALQNITIGVVNSRHVTSALRDTLAVVGQRIEELNTNIKTIYSQGFVTIKGEISLKSAIFRANKMKLFTCLATPRENTLTLFFRMDLRCSFT